jgi:hypothetical protein
LAFSILVKPFDIPASIEPEQSMTRTTSRGWLPPLTAIASVEVV